MAKPILPDGDALEEIRALLIVLAHFSKDPIEDGWINRGNLEHALDAAHHGPYLETGDIAERLAHIVRAMTTGHCYADGSKRTALLTMAVYLDVNGRKLTADEDEAVEFLKDCASGREDLQGIAAWMRRHSKARRAKG